MECFQSECTTALHNSTYSQESFITDSDNWAINTKDISRNVMWCDGSIDRSLHRSDETRRACLQLPTEPSLLSLPPQFYRYVKSIHIYAIEIDHWSWRSISSASDCCQRLTERRHEQCQREQQQHRLSRRIRASRAVSSRKPVLPAAFGPRSVAVAASIRAVGHRDSGGIVLHRPSEILVADIVLDVVAAAAFRVLTGCPSRTVRGIWNARCDSTWRQI